MGGDVTLLLHAHRKGDQSALEQLARLVYPDLKAMARRRTRGDQAMSASTLVNETFLKLIANGRSQPDDRRGFFALMATIMRQIIIDEVRQAKALKRDGKQVLLEEDRLSSDADESERMDFLLDVDRALSELKSSDERLLRVFECRFFAGFTSQETAEALDIPLRTVERIWADARQRVAEFVDS